MPAEWCRNTVTQVDIDGQGCIPLPQHICCLQFHDGVRQTGLDRILPPAQKGRPGVYGSIPHPTNHSASVIARAEEFEKQKTKRGAVSDFCLCLFEHGEIFQLTDRCCSLYQRFDTPGLDPRTSYPFCRKLWHGYNTKTDEAGACLLRADLYPRMKDALAGRATPRAGRPGFSGGGSLDRSHLGCSFGLMMLLTTNGGGRATFQ